MENNITLSNYTSNRDFDEGNQNDKKERLNITLYLISKTISLLGTNVYTFALSLFILKTTGSGTSFAINVLIGMLPRIILGPFAGVFADRMDRKKITVLLDFMSGVIVFGLLGLSSVYGLKIIFIYITGFILSTMNVFYDTSLSASLPNLVRDNKLMKINTFSSVSMSLSGILSPIIGGLIFGLVSINIFLILNGISFIVSSGLEVFMNFNLNKSSITAPKESMTLSSFKTDIVDIITFIKNQSILMSLFKYALLTNFFLTASMSVVYPYVIIKVLLMKSSQFGTIEAFFSIGILIASVIIGARKEKEKKLKTITLGIALMGAILILIGLPTLGLSIFNIMPILLSYNILIMFIMGVTIVIVNAPIMVMIQRLTPDNLRGRIMGVLGTLTGGIAPLGIIISGLIIDKLHPFAILLTCGIITIGTAIKAINSKLMRDF
jgi:MFS transporter, DHA3 family, macrolide efflux protein